MQDIIFKAFVDALKIFIEKENSSQKQFADRIGWQPGVLNNVLTGRKNIGDKRQKHLIKVLGKEFENDVNKRVEQLLANKKGKEEAKPKRNQE